ncbi:MAG: hypothetical protein ETSY1_20440 [Candidatus Entotheonella factor]|uniref:Uncharacterized protein n=1 Tax=Entotheonella factor TaxID=1429438 RepID=W4LJY3_ENTF1|nr:MAG: hypothetical protein ETSY1_20440 [Candidatus Entotheonella factor]
MGLTLLVAFDVEINYPHDALSTIDLHAKRFCYSGSPK